MRSLLWMVVLAVTLCGCRSEEPPREPRQPVTHGVYDDDPMMDAAITAAMAAAQ